MPKAVYNPQANTVLTFVRDDCGNYAPPDGFELVDANELADGWTFDTSQAEAAAAEAAQQLAQRRIEASEILESLDTPMGIVVRALAQLTLEQLNVLRARAGMALIDLAQFIEAIRHKIATLNGNGGS